MRWTKDNPFPNIKRTVLQGWDWAYPTFEFGINKEKGAIKTIVIDPKELMADINKANNIYKK